MDQPVRRFDLHVLSACDTSGIDLHAIVAAGPRIEARQQPHPVHRLVGSTRKAQTVSGLAAIAISRWTEMPSRMASMPSPLFSLSLALQGNEPPVPEAGKIRLQIAKPPAPPGTAAGCRLAARSQVPPPEDG